MKSDWCDVLFSYNVMDIMFSYQARCWDAIFNLFYELTELQAYSSLITFWPVILKIFRSVISFVHFQYLAENIVMFALMKIIVWDLWLGMGVKKALQKQGELFGAANM